MNLRRTIALAVAALAMAAGPADAPARVPRAQPGADAAPLLTVAVAVAPQGWLVERLCGEAVRVVVIVEPGMSHETYQPTDRHATEVMQARLLFGIGLPLERSPWMEAIRRQGRVRVVDCTAGIPARRPEAHGHAHDRANERLDGHDHDPDQGDAPKAPAAPCAHGHGGSDPHVWTTPALLAIQARTMAAAVVEAAPALKDRVDKALPALERELDALDNELRRTLEPCHGRAFFVFHPAWGYFADAYGLRQIAIEHEGKPPTDKELTDLQRLARAEGAKVIFVQPQISSRAAQAVAGAVGGTVETIDPLAADVPSNLRRVADAIARSCR